jgi:hypothetical protein
MDKPQENWIAVYQQEIVREELDDPLWLNEVLEDNNIPYRNEDRAVLEGSYDSFRATVDRFVLIPPEYKEQVEGFIYEYENPDPDGINQLFEQE